MKKILFLIICAILLAVGAFNYQAQSEVKASANQAQLDRIQSDQDKIDAMHAKLDRFEAEKAQEPREPVLVKEWKGDGMKTTQKFTVQSGWQIAWATRPGSFDGNFQIYVYDSKGGLVDLAANVIGEGSDTSFIHKSGTFYLQMSASQRWSVSVYQ